MALPYFPAGTGKTKRQIIAFGGLHYGEGAAEGELAESRNLSSARFPCLSQRRGRQVLQRFDAPTGLFARGKLCVVDGTNFLYDGKAVGQVTPGEKSFAAVHTKIVIFPDKACYDTASGTFEALEASETFQGGDLTFGEKSLETSERLWRDTDRGEREQDIPSDETLTVYSAAAVDKATGAVSLTGGEEKTVGALAPGDILQYQCGERAYMVVRSAFWQNETAWHVTYVLHEAEEHVYPALDRLFKAGDGVEISGCVDCPENNGTRIVRAVEGRKLTFTALPQTGEESGDVTLARRVPDLTCVCECGNRLWGAAENTIYASALGDPSNFFVYDGLSTDSYAVAVGTDGAFTACVPYASSVLFFKEDCVHKVLGSYPAQFEVYTYQIPGVQAGSERSAVNLGEVLYYKGRAGVYAYTGGTPELLSACFGTRRFSEAAAGTDGERYYISMRDGAGAWGLYTYDPARNIWLREDETRAAGFALLDGKLCWLDPESGQVVQAGAEGEDDLAWSAVLCPMDETGLERKGYSRLHLRCDLEAGAWLRVEISQDGGPFRQVYVTHNQLARTFQIPILPGRCDRFQIRLSGRGRCLVRSLVREFALGSEY